MNNSSISSASEYRPKDFSDMIGQDAIVKTLSNAIKNDKIPQALLFCGPRGVGKTSCARILAKQINNLEENFEYNIFELDAASNNSVEDIRSITDQIRIPPQIGKYKVYIIDEVHMLSNAAFNAFLKSLEEPPKHVVFILATTEKNKIIPTILSRCQIYDFKKVDVVDITELLKNICTDKKIKFDENSLSLIAEKSDGSIRDSLSMFDRLVSFTDSNLTMDEVTANLNVLDYETYFELSTLIISKDIPGILTKYNDIFIRGFDDVNLLNGLSRHLREILISKLGSSDKLSDLKNELNLKYIEHSNEFSDENLILMIEIINESLINYQKINDKRIHTELCLMRLASIESVKKKNL
ncbi:MAG: DNA polymerase III, subunit gamma and tau [Cryomorphaceae bacterium MED-G11]|nr:DNA polymerase III subunit gamma/tau [Flavobacteriaceae bacterium]PDH54203.1 MAG: DNA polymerase III, subunit gamma and tau [Cryomorphaceae bacterium MED-G11]|tara:strand:- start:4283 stop:5344 length:1062 start_codon:yes stop_codon:yes gene_type:complete